MIGSILEKLSDELPEYVQQALFEISKKIDKEVSALTQSELSDVQQALIFEAIILQDSDFLELMKRVKSDPALHIEKRDTPGGISTSAAIITCVLLLMLL